MLFEKNTLFGGNKKNINPDDPNREFKLMESVVVEAFEEQKKARRWGILFKGLTFAYLFIALFLFVVKMQSSSGPSAKKDHTAMIRIEGAIAKDKDASAGKINSSLRKAFKADHVKAIVLLINSPGGSPVQSGYVFDEVRRLREKHSEKPVYAVIEDLGASGGYYIAAAADFIYANRSSLVGSIGVTASSFGFVDTLGKLGVERRHFTAGEHKSFLDPFSPLKEKETAFWQSVLKNTHNQFIAAVEQGRGERLTLTSDITSGLIWNGEQALALGLIDGLGSISHVAREVIGVEDIIDYTYRDSPLKKIMSDFGVSIGKGLSHSVLNTTTPLELR